MAREEEEAMLEIVCGVLGVLVGLLAASTSILGVACRGFNIMAKKHADERDALKTALSSALLFFDAAGYAFAPRGDGGVVVVRMRGTEPPEWMSQQFAQALAVVYEGAAAAETFQDMLKGRVDEKPKLRVVAPEEGEPN